MVLLLPLLHQLKLTVQRFAPNLVDQNPKGRSTAEERKAATAAKDRAQRLGQRHLLKFGSFLKTNQLVSASGGLSLLLLFVVRVGAVCW